MDERAKILPVDERDGNRPPAGHVVGAAFLVGAVMALFWGLLIVIVESWSSRTPQSLTNLWAGTSFVIAFLALPLSTAAVLSVAPVHLLAMQFLAPHWPRIARWAYLAPVAGVSFLFLMFMTSFSSGPPPDFDTGAAVAVLVFAAPGALAFHLAVNRKPPVPGGWVLTALVIVWFAVWIVVLSAEFVAVILGPQRALITSRLQGSFNPFWMRDRVVFAWVRHGQLAMYLSGLAAFVIWQFRMPRIAAGLLIAGIALPFAFVGWYFSVPLGEELVRFKLGSRTVLIDWHRKPHKRDGGLSFNIADLEPYQIAGHRASNKTLRVEPAVGSLHDARLRLALPDSSSKQWGLTCYQINSLSHPFSIYSLSRPVSICGQPGSPQQWKTVLRVEKTSAHHTFDRGGIRYSLHYDVADVQNWRDIERATIDALETADMNRE